MRRVAVITGTRAEYGILKPVMDRIQQSSRMELILVVTGMHMSPEYGSTVREIEASGLKINARVDMLFSSDSQAAMAKGLGIGIYGIAQELEHLQPHIVVALGDRVEALAGALSGLFCNALVAHLHGGEMTQGGLDEYMRHAITKLSHLHFAATEKSRERIIKLGENPDYVYCVGTPGLDALLQFPDMSDEELSRQLGVVIPARFALIVQHSISTHPETTVDEIMETLTAIKYSGIPAFLVYPNADAGSRQMISVIRQFEAEGWLSTFVSLPREIYCNLLRRTAVLIGNSSSGMIDAPAYGIPVINIGERQFGRERGQNVIDVPPKQDEIEAALNRALTDKKFISECKHTKNPYGDGTASVKIASILESIDLEAPRKNKRLPW